MTLRIVLMGLVASMGLELPSGPEVSGWTRSGRDWAHARLADLSGAVIEAERPDPEPTDCRQADASHAVVLPGITEEAAAPVDAAFLAASEAMVAGFVADSKSIQDDRSPVEVVPEMLSSESPPVGLPAGEELPAVESDEVGEATAEMDPLATRAERVSSAIQLTR